MPRSGIDASIDPQVDGDFDPKDLEAVHTVAMDRHRRAFEYEEHQRELCQEDHYFCDEPGGQWGRRYFQRNTKRPRLEINQIRHVRNIVEGDYRQNKIGVKIRPADASADGKVAELYNGLIRNMMNSSNGECALDNALHEIATGGIGAIQLTTQYSTDNVMGVDAFDQDLVVRPVRDALSSVYMDPDSVDDNHRDAQFGFVTKRMTPQAFRARWPDANAGNFGMIGINGPAAGWRTTREVQVADYYIKEWYDETICLYTNGIDDVVYARSKLEGVEDELYESGYRKTRERKARLNRVHHYLLSGSEVLEGPNLWAGTQIPILVGYGYHGWIDGSHWYHGVVRPAKDPQRFHNYVFSAIAERCGKSVKDFYWMTPEQAANHGGVYRKANVEDRFAMPYNFDPNAPQGPIPSRQATMDPNLTMMMAESSDAIRRTTGYGVASLGDNPLDQSGKAIIAQQKQGDLGTFPILDNFAKLIEYLGEQCLDVMPRIYDNERQMRVMDQTGQTEVVYINRQVMDAETGESSILNDLSQGKYDLVRDTGPSFNTKRAEALNFFTQILQTNLPLAQLFAPLMIKWLDVPFGDEMRALVDWWALNNGMRPPTDQEKREMANQPPPIEQRLAMERIRLELEKLAAEIDSKELENDETKAKIAETYAKVADIMSKLDENGFATPQQMRMSAEAMESLGMVLQANQEDAAMERNAPPANPQDSIS